MINKVICIHPNGETIMEIIKQEEKKEEGCWLPESFDTYKCRTCGTSIRIEWDISV